MKSVLVLQGLTAAAFAQYAKTFTPDNTPDTWQEGQTGTNKCGTGSDQSSKCQNAFLNSVDDFCLFAPPEPGAGSSIGETERIEVSWCLKSGYGTRLIPDGTLRGVHFVKTPDYVQVTGVGDLTKLNIPTGDDGGELDPHGADGNGNPIGGIVFSNAFTGQFIQLHEWTNFMSAKDFCFRGCKDGPNAPALCQHIYDEMGCEWNMPANYDPGVFEQCNGDSGKPMGVYGGSTFHQGDPATPDPPSAPPSSQCSTVGTLSNGAVSSSGTPTPTSSASSSGTPHPTSTRSTAGRPGQSGSASRPGSATPSASSSNAVPLEFSIIHTLCGAVSIAFFVGAIGFVFGDALLV